MPDHYAVFLLRKLNHSITEPVLNLQATLLVLSCEYRALNASLYMEVDFEL